MTNVTKEIGRSWIYTSIMHEQTRAMCTSSINGVDDETVFIVSNESVNVRFCADYTAITVLVKHSDHERC
jgi:hypothetical protein